MGANEAPTTDDKPFCIEVHASNPEREDDACCFGVAFETLEQARTAYDNPATVAPAGYVFAEGEWVLLAGPPMTYEQRPLVKGEWTLSKRAIRKERAVRQRGQGK